MILLPMNGQRGQICQTPEGALTANFINGVLYAVGGIDALGTSNTNMAYNPKTNTWASEQPMPTPRHGLASVSIDYKIYVIGGGPQPGGSQTNLNEIFQSNR